MCSHAIYDIRFPPSCARLLTTLSPTPHHTRTHTHTHTRTHTRTQLDAVTNWPQFFRSAQWHQLVTLFSRITYHGYATAGTEAVAVALWALVTNWDHPRQAVSIAATFGGSAPVTAQIVGALAGALHGDGWIPHTWWEGLENTGMSQGQEQEGADEAGAGAMQPEGVASTGAEVQGAGQEEGATGEEELSGYSLGLRDVAVILAMRLVQFQCDGVGLADAGWQALTQEGEGVSAEGAGVSSPALA